MGDDIMLTAKLARLQQEYPHMNIVPAGGLKKLDVSAAYSNNPIFDHDPAKDTMYYEVKPRPYIKYFGENSSGTYTAFNDQHLVPGHIYLTDDEIERAKQVAPAADFIYIEPNYKKPGIYSDNKQWSAKKWQSVVDAFPDSNFVQCGNGKSDDSVLLDNVTMIYTKRVREAFAVLSLASMFIGYEGGMHHAAAALGKGGVVLFGGVSSPSATGYDLHINVYGEHPESPCGRHYECSHCKEVMKSLTADQVIREVKELIQSE